MSSEELPDIQLGDRFRCWQPGPIEKDGMSTTCILKRNHDGPHDYTRDDEISICWPKGFW